MKTSVALCTYNGEKFLREQLDSILNQTKAVDEIVVCDDGSTDSTLQILEEYYQKNPDIFRIFKNEINLLNTQKAELEKKMTIRDSHFFPKSSRYRDVIPKLNAACIA